MTNTQYTSEKLAEMIMDPTRIYDDVEDFTGIVYDYFIRRQREEAEGIIKTKSIIDLYFSANAYQYMNDEQKKAPENFEYRYIHCGDGFFNISVSVGKIDDDMVICYTDLLDALTCGGDKQQQAIIINTIYRIMFIVLKIEYIIDGPESFFDSKKYVIDASRVGKAMYKLLRQYEGRDISYSKTF